MQQQGPQTQIPLQERSPFPWGRLIVTMVIVLVLAGFGVLLFLATGHIIDSIWDYIIPVLFLVLGLVFTLLQWLFPFHPVETRRSTSPPGPSSPPSSANDARTLTPSPAQTSSNVQQQSAIIPISPLTTPSQIAPMGPVSVFHFNEPLMDPSELYGRVRERTTLLDRARKGASTSIVGPRRIGKTWLTDSLKLLAPTELGTSYQIASLDGTMPQCKTVSDFIVRTLDAFGVPWSPQQTNMDLEVLEKVVKNVKSKRMTPVLCVDEFEGLFNQQGFDCDFYAGLRYLAQHDGLILIISSKELLIDLVGEHCKTSGFFNIFETLTLKPFSREEAEEFVELKSKQAGFTHDEQATLLKCGHDKQRQTGWPPLRLQLAGKLLLADIQLARSGKIFYYRPDDAQYWREFEERLEATYRGAVS